MELSMEENLNETSIEVDDKTQKLINDFCNDVFTGRITNIDEALDRVEELRFGPDGVGETVKLENLLEESLGRGTMVVGVPIEKLVVIVGLVSLGYDVAKEMIASDPELSGSDRELIIAYLDRKEK